MDVKKCNRCYESKPLGAFSYSRGRPRPTCKECRCEEARLKYVVDRAQARADPSVHQYGTKKLPPGYVAKGISQFVGKDGEVKAQWIKSVTDKEQRAALLLESFEAMAKGYVGAAGTKPAPTKKLKEDLMNVVPIGDAHFGLRTWEDEVGENFDLKIAKRMMNAASDELFAMAPPADTATIINVGDYTHADGTNNCTTSGTPVDVDTRWQLVVGVALDCYCYMVDKALLTHNNVIVKNAIGNHDAATSVLFSLMLSKMYSSEPRVDIDTSPAKHLWQVWGGCLIGITHGDTGKLKDLPMIMAHDRPEDWARCLHRLWYTGHVHHDTSQVYTPTQELTGAVIVETCRTLAPSDKWHKGQGYRSGRDIKLDTWHKTRGRVGRIYLGIDQINEGLAV